MSTWLKRLLCLLLGHDWRVRGPTAKEKRTYQRLFPLAHPGPARFAGPVVIKWLDPLSKNRRCTRCSKCDDAIGRELDALRDWIHREQLFEAETRRAEREGL